MNRAHNESDETVLHSIEKQYEVARIHYDKYFLSLYIAYNAWYYRVTGTKNDRQALNALKKRHVIWHDYTNGKVMPSMRSYMHLLAELTQREPLSTTTDVWNGELGDSSDWRSLIEYWYQIRCKLVHGTEVRSDYVWLAYQTLAIFMEEVLTRMHAYSDREKEGKLHPLLSQNHAIWQVDMHYVELEAIQ